MRLVRRSAVIPTDAGDASAAHIQGMKRTALTALLTSTCGPSFFRRSPSRTPECHRCQRRRCWQRPQNTCEVLVSSTATMWLDSVLPLLQRSSPGTGQTTGE